MTFDHQMDSSQDASESTSDLPSSQSSDSGVNSQLAREKTDGTITDDYLSCCDILALGQRVTCNFEVNVDDLGFIDPASGHKDIAMGTKLELPLWLAKVLYSRGLVTIEVPKGYNETYREILGADANVVDLHTLGPNFYQFGKHTIEMKLKGYREISKSLVTSFHQRFHRILDFSLSGTADTQLELADYRAILDDSEVDILKTGIKFNEELKQWQNRSCERMKANEMVSTLKKKRFAALQEMNVIQVHPPADQEDP